ncbi:SHOCT domain-containing protein [Crassaminicella thermophila]|uniref:SHOCT domain-containing protein n=1 Tax=Crassaminicella thermophila TaxID=2599308 RepID=A0A5C0SG58_CRATE|nr:SHOCT domain-containing protein [Crassaminicella thermophila]QEK13341.1 SHOCT domain-containing protein [Crassaminicella thermophila]
MCGFGFGYAGWWPWMILRMGLGIVITIGFVIWITRLVRDYGYNRKHAIELLDEKFANGEIGEEEYMQKKKIIKGK